MQIEEREFCDVCGTENACSCCGHCIECEQRSFTDTEISTEAVQGDDE